MSDSAPPPSPAARPDLATATQLLADLTAAQPDRPRAPPLAVLPQMALTRGRVHELTGAARRTLACVAAGAAQAEGVVMWFRPGWRAGGLCPRGMAGFMPDPGAVIMGRCGRAVDVLWSMEEALRAGCVALVVGELAQAPDLRQIRRLHLAAAEGVARNQSAGKITPAPLGLIMAWETAQTRINGVESRWALHPVPPRDGAPHGWRLDRLLARDAPPCDWAVERRDLFRNGARHHVHAPPAVKGTPSSSAPTDGEAGALSGA